MGAHAAAGGGLALTAYGALAAAASVGGGAALGAWLRWGLSLRFNAPGSGLPLGTLAANLVGGYGVGLALGWLAQHPELSPHWRLFLVTGLLGGLTTFSTFSAEVVERLLQGRYGWALALAAVHLLGSLALTALGLATVRRASAYFSAG